MKPTQQSHGDMEQMVIGVDVGSTTVKVVVLNPATDKILWKQSGRHYAKQADKALELLSHMHRQLALSGDETVRIFITGSGGSAIAATLGAKFIQEVNAVTMAVEKNHPDVNSVIELGGQDAKIIHFRTNPKTGERQVMAFMNDKCASGTGVVIDKCLVKVGMSLEEASQLSFDDSRIHPVAAKCGIFAETDIISLVKAGIPSDEIMCSLANAIVQQNLTALTHGYTLEHKVLLLGGPNTYFPFLQQCWQQRIPEVWQERGYDVPADVPVEDLIHTPADSQYYAAIGAAIYGLKEPTHVGVYKGLDGLKKFAAGSRSAKLGILAGPPLVHSQEELEAFRRQYAVPAFQPASLQPGHTVRAVIGIDGGSTSSKAVLVDDGQRVLFKAYELSKGNPLQDTKDLLGQIHSYISSQDATVDIVGLGVTGYAGDILDKSLCADVNVVETIAHLQSSVHYFGEVDVICDIGGQDIKIMFMKNGEIRNFRLSNQCSAGNGMLLQTMASEFNIPIEEYADVAFRAKLSPVYSYGCGVFLDADRVTFQKEGFSKEELLAGLAMVLPKNIWQYVAQIPRLAALGNRFVLQGGTQHNLAAVKAQVDYIKERVPDAKVYVHPHTGEAGAIGAAFEAIKVVRDEGKSTFIGLDNALQLTYSTRSDETTRCNFCANHCRRTFIDIHTPAGGSSRYISGFNCEKGTVDNTDDVRQINRNRKERKRRYPNLVEYETHRMFQHFYEPQPLPQVTDNANTATSGISRGLFRTRRQKDAAASFRSSSNADRAYRQGLRIGIPRALNIWATAPFWRTYLETLGIQPGNIVFSDYTSDTLWLEGGKYGSIDPCFPAKVASAHVYNLLFKWHSRRPLNYILFPCITHLDSPIQDALDMTSCAVVAGTPNVVKAAFRKERDVFAEKNVGYLDAVVNFADPLMLKRQLFDALAPVLRVTEDESEFAVDEALTAMETFSADMQARGKAILEQAERDGKLAILMIGRPYHDDPFLHLDILEEFQMLGYPILSMSSIPKDESWLNSFFQEDIQAGRVTSALSIGDVWTESFSANSVLKVWSAKFAARHPNVAVIDLSSFKCGHDAPSYGIVDAIVSTANIPYLPLHDIDANKSAGSLQLRVRTFAHTLREYEESLQPKNFVAGWTEDLQYQAEV